MKIFEIILCQSDDKQNLISSYHKLLENEKTFASLRVTTSCFVLPLLGLLTSTFTKSHHFLHNIIMSPF